MRLVCIYKDKTHNILWNDLKTCRGYLKRIQKMPCIDNSALGYFFYENNCRQFYRYEYLIAPDFTKVFDYKTKEWIKPWDLAQRDHCGIQYGIKFE
jgi:hypothetical protein